MEKALVMAQPPCSLHSCACQSVHQRTSLHPEGNQSVYKVRLSQRIWLNFDSRPSFKQIYLDVLLASAYTCAYLFSNTLVCFCVRVPDCFFHLGDLSPAAVHPAPRPVLSRWAAGIQLGLQAGVFQRTCGGVGSESGLSMWVCVRVCVCVCDS